MTAGARAEDRERCLAAGMDDYVSKPVAAEELEETLARWVNPADHQIDSEAPRDSIEQRLNELRGDGSPGENELVDRLVDHFLVRAPEMTSALFHALDRNIGAQGLADCCTELEQYARAGDPAPLTQAVPRLQEELDRACRTLETLRSRPRRSGPG